MEVQVIDRYTGNGYSPVLLDDPSWTLNEFGGPLRAIVRPVLDGTQRQWIKGAIIRITDESASWWGIAWNTPDAGGVLVVLGWSVLLRYQLREALYSDTSVSTWKERTIDAREKDTVTLTTSGSTLRFVWDGAVVDDAYNGFWRRIPPDQATVRVKFSWSRPDTGYELYLRSSNYAPRASDGRVRGASAFTTHWSKVSPAADLTGTETIDCTLAAGDDFLLFEMSKDGAETVSDEVVYFHSLEVLGVDGVISTTTENIMADVVEKEMDPFYFPDGTNVDISEIGAEGTVLSPLVFGHSHGIDKLDALPAYTPWVFGFYEKRISGRPWPVPHWYARSVVPDYVVDLNDVIGTDLREEDLEPTASAVRVLYSDEQGYGEYVDRFDDDPAHRLVAMGMNTASTAKFATLQVQTTSSGLAESLGDQFLADAGRDQLRGTVTDARIRTASGDDMFPMTGVRPGQMVRVYGFENPVDVTVREVQGRGGVGVLSLDNSSYRIDREIARLSIREQPFIPSNDSVTVSNAFIAAGPTVTNR